MNITDRQKTILESLVEGYIRSAHPISSQWLEEEAGFDFSPATIRNELLALTERGYLEQPHVSAGRVPTDRGYRFVVDGIIEELKEQELAEEIADHFALLERLTGSSSALVMGYVPGSRRIFQEGWERLLREPEFGERGSLWNLTKFVEDVAKRLPAQAGMAGFLPAKAMEVYIGKENPFSKVKDFTVILRRYGTEDGLPRSKAGLVAMVGPRRMEYGKNIELITSYGRRKDN